MHEKKNKIKKIKTMEGRGKDEEEERKKFLNVSH